MRIIFKSYYLWNDDQDQKGDAEVQTSTLPEENLHQIDGNRKNRQRWKCFGEAYVQQ